MANPTLGENILKNDSFHSLNGEHAMTINGTILKTCLLCCMTFATFAYTWSLILAGFTDKAIMLTKFGLLGASALVFVIMFAPKNKFLILTTSLYALCEGLLLGCISAVANRYYPGAATQAAIGTFFALFGMLFLYKTGLVKCTDKVCMVIINSTLAIGLLYLIQIVLSFFNISIPFIFSNGLFGIGFSIFVIVLATFNLVVDFNNIERFSGKVDKHMEWYFGFALLVTIIWMYLEILRLIIKLQNRNS